jgi:hypothetical protein
MDLTLFFLDTFLWVSYSSCLLFRIAHHDWLHNCVISTSSGTPFSRLPDRSPWGYQSGLLGQTSSQGYQSESMPRS